MKIVIDPGHKFLFQKYQTEGLSLTQIGNICGVSYETIRRWLRIHNINVRKCGPHKGAPSHLKGIKKSEEFKRKVSMSMKGRAPWNKGKPRDQNTKNKISQNLLGRYSGEKNPFYGKKHKVESIAKIKANHADVSRENNPAWLGGKSYEPYGIEFNQELKVRIRQRDNFTCQLCQIKEQGRAHDVHHIDYNKRHNLDDNLITLCHLCHHKTNINRQYWTEYFDGTISQVA